MKFGFSSKLSFCHILWKIKENFSIPHSFFIIILNRPVINTVSQNDSSSNINNPELSFCIVLRNLWPFILYPDIQLCLTSLKKSALAAIIIHKQNHVFPWFCLLVHSPGQKTIPKAARSYVSITLFHSLCDIFTPCAQSCSHRLFQFSCNFAKSIWNQEWTTLLSRTLVLQYCWFRTFSTCTISSA